MLADRIRKNGDRMLSNEVKSPFVITTSKKDASEDENQTSDETELGWWLTFMVRFLFYQMNLVNILVFHLYF